jgi:hypothetical protein
VRCAAWFLKRFLCRHVGEMAGIVKYSPFGLFGEGCAWPERLLTDVLRVLDVR